MIFTVNRKENYTLVHNTLLRDKNLSLRSIGLFTKILSLPAGWDFSEAGLAAICKDGITSVRSSLNELEKYGYLNRGPIRKDGKVVDWFYDFYEDPSLNDKFNEK